MSPYGPAWDDRNQPGDGLARLRRRILAMYDTSDISQGQRDAALAALDEGRGIPPDWVVGGLSVEDFYGKDDRA